MGSRQRPTIKTVAARAGVGRTTVSRVINGSELVSDEARSAVLAAIAELNYVPNSVARGLVTSRTDSVALVIPESESRLGSSPTSPRSSAASALVSPNGGSSSNWFSYATRPSATSSPSRSPSAGWTGCCWSRCTSTTRCRACWRTWGCPPSSPRRAHGEPLSHVRADNEGGAAAAVAHLVARGRRRIATISGPLDMDVSRSRLDGWRDALRGEGVEAAETLVASADFTEAAARPRCVHYLNASPAWTRCSPPRTSWRPRAGGTAPPGPRVPDDVALIGFDDSVVARHSNPPLTSVRQPVEAIGRTMARILLAEIDEPGQPRQHVVLPTELVVRRSS
ncbi:LacI family DNA-binding transcriptional regulator [Actinomadura keratinilytica]